MNSSFFVVMVIWNVHKLNNLGLWDIHISHSIELLQYFVLGSLLLIFFIDDLPVSSLLLLKCSILMMIKLSTAYIHWITRVSSTSKLHCRVYISLKTQEIPQRRVCVASKPTFVWILFMRKSLKAAKRPFLLQSREIILSYRRDDPNKHLGIVIASPLARL